MSDVGDSIYYLVGFPIDMFDVPGDELLNKCLKVFDDVFNNLRRVLNTFYRIDN